MDRAARVTSEVLAPVVLAYVTCVTVAVATSTTAGRGVLVGTVTATLCAGLPYMLVVAGSRRRMLSGRHVPELRERPMVLLGSAVSATAGLLGAVWLDASRELVALIVATVAGLVVAAWISRRWRLSIHMAGAAGALSAVALTSSVWTLLALPVVAVLGWARVHLGAHDVAQVVGGAVIGSTVTVVVMIATAQLGRCVT